MALTTEQQTALNSLPLTLPPLASAKTGNVPLLLGDELAAAQTGVPQSAVPALKTAAAPTAEADAAVTAVADAVGDVGSGALANDLKAKYNAMVALVNDLKAKYNALANGIDSLP